MFERHTGYAWCEPKYEVSEYIAEFANTVTNLPLILHPLIMLTQLGPYVRRVNRRRLVPVFMVSLVGIASCVYHATLSLFAQILDELSILWVVTAVFYTVMPCMRYCLPDYVQRDVEKYRMLMLLTTGVCSALAFVHPIANAFALFGLSAPMYYLIMQELIAMNNDKAVNTLWMSLVLWGLSIACWMADRAACDALIKLGIPYMHAIFHVLAGLAVHHASIALYFIDISSKTPQLDVQIRNIFGEKWKFGIPYLKVAEKHARVA